jgi:hypothetical protein
MLVLETLLGLARNFHFYCLLYTLGIALIIIFNVELDSNTMSCLLALLCVVSIL